MWERRGSRTEQTLFLLCFSNFWSKIMAEQEHTILIPCSHEMPNPLSEFWHNGDPNFVITSQYKKKEKCMESRLYVNIKKICLMVSFNRAIK